MADLVLFITHESGLAEEVADQLEELGVSWTASIDLLSTVTNLERLTRDDMPLMPSLRDIFDAEEAPGKAVMCVVGSNRMRDMVLQALRARQSGSEKPWCMVLSMPLSGVWGLPPQRES